MKFLVAALLVSFSAAALADQCAYNTRAHATNALEFIRRGQTIAHKCEPCGDTTIRTERVRSVNVKKRGQYAEVVVNGKGVDLAYVYTLVNGRTYYNVAGLVGCEATGVSFTLPRN